MVSRLIQKWGTDDNSLFVTGILGFTADDKGLYVTSSSSGPHRHIMAFIENRSDQCRRFMGGRGSSR
jgi:hypothetical protein